MIIDEFDEHSGNLTIVMSATQAMVLLHLVENIVDIEIAQDVADDITQSGVPVKAADAYAHLEGFRAILSEFRSIVRGDFDEEEVCDCGGCRPLGPTVVPPKNNPPPTVH